MIESNLVYACLTLPPGWYATRRQCQDVTVDAAFLFPWIG
jgi:hypothetical protein